MHASFTWIEMIHDCHMLCHAGVSVPIDMVLAREDELRKVLCEEHLNPTIVLPNTSWPNYHLMVRGMVRVRSDWLTELDHMDVVMMGNCLGFSSSR